MKPMLLTLLTLLPVFAHAEVTPSRWDVLQSTLPAVTLERTQNAAVLLSPAENTQLADELGFAEKARLFRAITEGEALERFLRKYPESGFSHAAGLLQTVVTISATEHGPSRVGAR